MKSNEGHRGQRELSITLNGKLRGVANLKSTIILLFSLLVFHVIYCYIKISTHLSILFSELLYQSNGNNIDLK